MPVQFALNPQILKRVPLFSTFTEQQLNAVLAYVQHRRYPRGALIVRAGDETDALYIILAGRVKVLIQDDEGHEVILSMMGPHDFFGEMGLLDDQPRSASVETLEELARKEISGRDWLEASRSEDSSPLLFLPVGPFELQGETP